MSMSGETTEKEEYVQETTEIDETTEQTSTEIFDDWV